MAMSSNEDKIVEDSLCLFNEGWSKINAEIAKSPKNKAIIVLGMTGCGKSTVAEISSGDLTKLNSVPVRYGNGFVIVDDGEGELGRIGDPQVASKTFLPEFRVCEQDPSLVILDNPGFGENRGVHMDIAAMALIKKIADQVEKVKLVIVVSASSVTYSNMQRNEFSQLCTYVTSFVKNLEKIEDSVCLVINKVNNLDPCSGMIIEEDSVKDEVAHFLKEVADQQVTSAENKKLIGFLLKDDSKWAVIRYPSKEGNLSEMEHFSEIQSKLIGICRDKLKYGCVTKGDFAVTITPQSKYIVGKKLIPFIKEEVDRKVENFVSILVNEFVEGMKREHLLCDESEQVISCIEILNKVGMIRENVTKCEAENTLFPVKASEKIKVFEKLFGINLPVDQVGIVERLEEQLNLFGEMTDEHYSDKGASFRVIRAVNRAKLRLEKFYNETLEIAKENVHVLECAIKPLAQVIIRDVMKNYEGDILKLRKRDSSGKEVIEKLDSDWNRLEILDRDGMMGVNKLSGVIICIGNVLQTEVGEELKKKLLEKENELEMLLEIILQKASYFISGAPNLLAEVRNAVRTIRLKTWENIRENGVVDVHNEMRERIGALIGFLEGLYFEEQIYKDVSINTLSEKRQMLASVHQQLKRCSGRVNRIEDFFASLFEIVGQGIPENGKRLAELEQLLDFYDEKLGSPLARPIDNWMECVRELEERLDKLNTLLEFLEKCKNSDLNGVPGFDVDVAVKGKCVVIENFLNAFQASVEIRQIVDKVAGQNEKILILEIARWIAGGKTKLGKTHEPGKMIVKGKHVRFSDVVTLISQESNGWPRKLLVEAEEWVEFDRNLDAESSGLDLTVIAPKWIFKGNTITIQLSGNAGPSLTERKAGSGRDFGEDGSDGKEGNWGGNGGNFFGIYREVVNGEGIRIFANGGNGGDGQDGGDGFIGRDPRESDSTGFRPPPMRMFGNNEQAAAAIMAATLALNLIDYLKSRGAEGCRGGNGGDGGDSGYPGAAGVVQLIRVEGGVNEFGTICCRNGNAGCAGEGGQGARGGRGCSAGRNGGCGSVRKAPQETGQVSAGIDPCDLKEYRRFIKEDIPHSEKGKEFLELMSQHKGIHTFKSEFN